MNPFVCPQCKRSKTKYYKNELCVACTITQRNEKRLDELERDFSSRGEFNELIFKTYLSDVKQGKISVTDVALARRLTGILSREQIERPQSWEEAVALSARLDIHYAVVPKIACPILRFAQALESEGVIAEKPKPFRKSFENILWVFDPKTRVHIDAYLAEISVGQRSDRSALRVASIIQKIYRFRKGADLFAVDGEMAQLFLESLDFKSVATVSDVQDQLKRFYDWNVKNHLSASNPFDGERPAHLTRVCEKCRRVKVFEYHERLCNHCYNWKRHADRLDQLVKSYRSSVPYHQHLFDLYIQYVRRSVIIEPHIRSGRALIEFLDTKPLLPIRSWSDVTTLSSELAQTQKRPLRQGCPIIKIGRMLEELGVLPVRQTDREVLLKALFARCPEEASRALRRYHRMLVKRGCGVNGRYGTTRTIAEFQFWITENEPSLSLFTLSQETVLRYLQALNDQDRSGIRRRAISRFYRWAQLEKLTLMNPVKGIPIPKLNRRMSVCDEKQIRQIEAFVKNPDSDPEYALMLALVLYWGLITVELTLSTIDIHGSQIWINLHRRHLGPGRKSHNRNQILKLPLTPEWLAELQKRYIRVWRDRYEQAQKSFPLQPLILRRGHIARSNRHLGQSTVHEYFNHATMEATGYKIPPNILRRTSGHIHVDQGDASRLTKLGWSQSSCNDFSTLPRTYFTPDQTS